MGNENDILLEVTAHVATIMLNRPDVHNAFDETMIGHLTEKLEELAGREDIAAVVLRGKGRSFSAGGDIGWMKRAAAYDEARNRDDARRLAAMLERLDTMPQVTIAAVHGSAMGGGMGLACCCDIVIADQAAVFATSEVKLGLIPATISPYVIAAIGARQARRYFQTGERITTSVALQIGLVHEMVGKAEDIERRLEDILVTLRDNGPQAMRAAKRLVLDIAGTPGEAVREKTAALIAQIRASAEGKEGVAAFLDKRKPNWV